MLRKNMLPPSSTLKIKKDDVGGRDEGNEKYTQCLGGGAPGHLGVDSNIKM